MQIKSKPIISQNLKKPKAKVSFKSAGAVVAGASALTSGAAAVVSQDYEIKRKQGLVPPRDKITLGICTTIGFLFAAVEAYFLVFWKK